MGTVQRNRPDRSAEARRIVAACRGTTGASSPGTALPREARGISLEEAI